MAIDDGIKRMAQELGGQRALDNVEALCRELKEYHDQHGSEVKENEKGRWGGALYAWIRKGRPVAVHGQPTPTEEEQVVSTMMIVKQYNIRKLHDLFIQAGQKDEHGMLVSGGQMNENQLRELERLRLEKDPPRQSIVQAIGDAKETADYLEKYGGESDWK
jgi:hypothetical protein